MPDLDIAVIGAGPYGLAGAAYLQATGAAVRVFGQPMEFWADKMPAGMLLRSPRVASTIADPRAALTLEAFETASHAKPSAPVPLDTFVGYGRWFHQKLGSIIDTTKVAQVRRENSRFRLGLYNGASITAGRVVVAAGIGPFASKPQPFTSLPGNLVSHCYEGTKIAGFKSRQVAVIGAGQSALESAALLREAGANVEVIARIPALRWIGQHPWLHHLGPVSAMLYSKHDIGPAGISRLVAAPKIVYHFPLGWRDKVRKRAVRPAGSAWLPDRLREVKVTASTNVTAAKPVGDQLHLTLSDGTTRQVDHVLLGTGYNVDISRYEFLGPDLLAGIQKLDGYPNLGPGFGSSIPGLHFVGATAARNFGPLLYFVTGTEFAAAHLASHIHRSRGRVGY